METYRVQLTAGPYSWTCTHGDPATLDDGPILADPLVVTWTQPAGQTRPAQPDPLILQFAVVAADAADVRLGLGDQVTAKVWYAASAVPATTEAPDITFRGRIAEGSSEIRGSRIVFSFTCSDQSVDLAGAPAGSTGQPVQTWTDRLAAFVAAAAPALAGGTVLADPRLAAGISAALWIDELAASPGKVRDAIGDLFDQVAIPGTGAYAGNTFYRPVVAAGPDAAQPIALDLIADRFIPTAEAPGPATFGWDGTCYGVLINVDDRHAGVLDAGFLELPATWSAFKADVVTSAVVTTATAAGADPEVNPRTPVATFVSEALEAGEAPILATRDTAILGLTAVVGSVAAAAANADALGHLMIPPVRDRAGWSPEKFTWRLDEDDLGRENFPVIFPAHQWPMNATGQVLRTVAYVRPIVVAGIPEHWNVADPTASEVAGQLTEVRATIAGGRPKVELTLAPTLPDVGGPGGSTRAWTGAVGNWPAQVGTWDDLPAGYIAFNWTDSGLVGVDWTELCPDDTWNAYLLVRGT